MEYYLVTFEEVWKVKAHSKDDAFVKAQLGNRGKSRARRVWYETIDEGVQLEEEEAKENECDDID